MVLGDCCWFRTRIWTFFGRSLDIRASSGKIRLMRRREANEPTASSTAKTANPAIAESEIARADLSKPAANANGRTIMLVQRSSLVRGTIMAGSSGYRDLLKNLLNDLGGIQPIDFKLRSQNQTVFQNRYCHGFDIVGSHEIPARHGSVSAGGHDERLCGAWPGAHQYAFMLPRRSDHVHQIGDQFFSNDDIRNFLLCFTQILNFDYRINSAGSEQRFGRLIGHGSLREKQLFGTF